MNHRPLVVQVHSADNVAIVASPEGLPAGAEITPDLHTTEPVPQSHKIALARIGCGEPVRRYGQIIGLASRDIAAGEWVREDSLSLPEAPPLADLELPTARPGALAPLEGFTFEGFRNPDGSAGTKNLLAITTTVQCVAPTVEFAVRRLREEVLPKYPNVDGILALTHAYGCGVAINAPGAEIPIRTIANLARNPNFGGEPLAVSLGCEKLQPHRLEQIGMRGDEDRPWVVRLQDESYFGFGDMVEAIMSFSEQRLAALNRRTRVTCPASDLVVGVQCGGSDAFSGITANPAVGYAVDLLVRAGATVMFSEVSEVRDAIHLLTERAASADVARALIRQMQWFDDYLRRGDADRSANPTPGNKRGGLANIVEKALGSVAKSGSTAINAVTGPGERVATKGLVFAATPASDFVCGTLQLAAGMNMHVFTTGEGTPYGLAAVPVVKVSSRTALAERWPDLIDVDAGTIATGNATIQGVGWEIFHYLLSAASGGKKTWSDYWGLHNDLALFNPAPVT